MEQTTGPSLSDLHRRGRQKDSVGRVAARAHASARQVATVIDYHDIPPATRARIERTIAERNG
jgi:hypothetical protein